MNKNLICLFVIGVLFSTTAQAQYKFDSLNPSCPLKKFVGGKWENASASELADKSLPSPKSLSGSATAAGIKFNNTWYSASSQCFASITAPGNEAAPLPVAEPQETVASPPKKSYAQKNSGPHELPLVYLRLEGGYFMDLSENSKAHTDTSSGTSVVYSAATHPITLGGALGFNINDQYSMEIRVNKSGLKQISTAGGIGTISENVSMLDLHLGTYFHILRGPISPFIGANLGYSSLSDEFTASEFNSAPSFNGVGNATASGIGFGGILGCDITVAGGFAIVPTISYKTVSFKPKITSSTSAGFTVGQELSEASVKYFLFGLGLQYSF